MKACIVGCTFYYLVSSNSVSCANAFKIQKALPHVASSFLISYLHGLKHQLSLYKRQNWDFSESSVTSNLSAHQTRVGTSYLENNFSL